MMFLAAREGIGKGLLLERVAVVNGVLFRILVALVSTEIPN